MEIVKKLTINNSDFTLERQPRTKKGDLRAWDAADELLINTLLDSHLQSTDKEVNKPILIINDSFGALACVLHLYPRHSWSDSYLTHLATRENLHLNKLDTSKYLAIPSIENLKVSYDLVIIKIPKTLGLLEDQLYRLKAHINTGTTIIAAGMSKHIHTSTLKMFEKIIGTTTTSRATKKARLAFVTNDAANNNKKESLSTYPKIIRDDVLDLTLINHANVFAKDNIDIGSRFLIEQLKNVPESKHIVDLGCGNGALGIMAQRLQPQAHISFIDESYAAVASATENYRQEIKEAKSNASFYISDCFNQFDNDANERIDLILCNPPFHQNHSIGDHIAWEMFKQSLEQLQNGGEIWVIGNRHLAYHVKLQTLFGTCETVVSNKKFVILVAKKNDEKNA